MPFKNIVNIKLQINNFKLFFKYIANANEVIFIREQDNKININLKIIRLIIKLYLLNIR